MFKKFFSKKKKNSRSYDEEERHVLSSAGSISTGMSIQKSRATLITSQIASENNPSYEIDFTILFKVFILFSLNIEFICYILF